MEIRIAKVFSDKATSCVEAKVLHNAGPEQFVAEIIALSFRDNQMGQ
jgi:hypothetical protein